MENLNKNTGPDFSSPSEAPIPPVEPKHSIGSDGYIPSVPASGETVSGPGEQITEPYPIQTQQDPTERLSPWKSAGAGIAALGSAWALQRGINHEALRAQSEHVINHSVNAGSVALLGLRRSFAQRRLHAAGRKETRQAAREAQFGEDADFHRNAARLTNMAAHRHEANTYTYVEIPTHTRQDYAKYRVSEEKKVAERNRRGAAQDTHYTPEPTPLDVFLRAEMGFGLGELTAKPTHDDLTGASGMAARRETGWRKVREFLEQDYQRQQLENSRERETNIATQKGISREIEGLADATHARTARQGRAALRNNLRNDAITRQRFNRLAALRLYEQGVLGDDQFDLTSRDAVRQIINSKRMTRAQRKALWSAHRRVAKYERSNHRIQRRLDTAADGENLAGTVLGRRQAKAAGKAAEAAQNRDRLEGHITSLDEQIVEERAQKAQRKAEKQEAKAARKAAREAAKQARAAERAQQRAAAEQAAAQQAAERTRAEEEQRRLEELLGDWDDDSDES